MPILDPNNKLKKKNSPTAEVTPIVGGSARGNDFAENFSSSDMGQTIKNTKISTTPRSKSELKKASFNVAGGGPVKTQEQLKQESIQRAKKIKSSNNRRKKITSTGNLASDNLRASNVNQTKNQSITEKGGRSSKITLENKPLTDTQIADLAARGFKEGDFIPGEGRLLPNGTLDRSALKTLDDISKKTQDVVAQFNKLKQNEISAAESAVVSDTPVIKEEKAAVESVAGAAKESPITQTLSLLDRQIIDINNQLQNDIRQIGRDFKQAGSKLETGQAQEMGQQSVQLANAGGYLGYTGSGQAVILKLAESHRAELTALDVARQKAINDAKSAAAERKFDVVREKAQAVQRIEEAAYEAELKYQAEVKAEQQKEIVKQKELQTQADIMDAIKGGAKNVTAIFEKLQGTVDVETINKTLKDITADVGDGFKFSASNNAALLGAGLGMDDIRAANEYINENGYDETLRSNLTPSQRAAMDKIFLPIQKVTGSTSSTKPMTILDLDRLEESYGVRFPFGVTQGEVTQFFADNPGVTPEEMQDAINASFGGTAAGGDGGKKIEVNKEWLTTNLDIDQQKRLADLVGASSWWTGQDTDVNRMYNDPGLMQSLSNKIDELRKQGYSDDDILTALTT